MPKSDSTLNALVGAGDHRRPEYSYHSCITKILVESAVEYLHQNNRRPRATNMDMGRYTCGSCSKSNKLQLLRMGRVPSSISVHQSEFPKCRMVDKLHNKNSLADLCTQSHMVRRALWQNHARVRSRGPSGYERGHDLP